MNVFEKAERAMLALPIVRNNKLREEIIGGRITTAIIKGYWGDYASGYSLMLCCHLDSWAVLADIVEVSLLRQCAISQKDIEAAGYLTREEMACKLKECYPDLDKSTLLTVIQWKNVRGRLIDDFRRKEELENDEGHCT